MPSSQSLHVQWLFSLPTGPTPHNMMLRESTFRIIGAELCIPTAKMISFAIGNVSSPGLPCMTSDYFVRSLMLSDVERGCYLDRWPSNMSKWFRVQVIPWGWFSRLGEFHVRRSFDSKWVEGWRVKPACGKLKPKSIPKWTWKEPRQQTWAFTQFLHHREIHIWSSFTNTELNYYFYFLSEQTVAVDSYISQHCSWFYCTYWFHKLFNFYIHTYLHYLPFKRTKYIYIFFFSKL